MTSTYRVADSTFTGKYTAGSVIEYTPFGGGTRRVRVAGTDSDIKNGRPGFDGVLVNAGDVTGMEVWGYDSQITRILTR